MIRQRKQRERSKEVGDDMKGERDDDMKGDEDNER